MECLKQTNHQCGLYRYLPSLDNGGAGGPVSCPPKKCQDCPTVGILMVMRLSATTLVSVVPLLVSVPMFSYEDKNNAKGGGSIFYSELGKERYNPYKSKLFSMYTKTKTLHVWNTFRHHGVKMVFRPPSRKAVKRSLADTSPEPSFKFYLLATISSLEPPLTPPYLIIAPLPPPLTSPFPTRHHH